MLCWCYMKYSTLHQGGRGRLEVNTIMCVRFIFWDVEINNDFEDIKERSSRKGVGRRQKCSTTSNSDTNL